MLTQNFLDSNPLEAEGRGVQAPAQREGADGPRGHAGSQPFSCMGCIIMFLHAVHHHVGVVPWPCWPPIIMKPWLPIIMGIIIIWPCWPPCACPPTPPCCCIGI